MEVVAGAASIAGLIGLAGQCIIGAAKMVSFCNEVRMAGSRAQQLKDNVNSLLRTLQDAAELCEKLEHDVPATGAQAKITSLQYHLEDCNKAMCGWIAIIKKHQQSSERAWFKQVWHAVNKTLRDDLHKELDRRRQEISLTLTLIGSTINLKSAKMVAELAPAYKTTEGNIATLQKDLAKSHTNEEVHFGQLLTSLQDQRSAIDKCSSSESIESLRSEISAGFLGLQRAIHRSSYAHLDHPQHSPITPSNLSEPFSEIAFPASSDGPSPIAYQNHSVIDTVDTRILLKWIGAGRPRSLKIWVRDESWCRRVNRRFYHCKKFGRYGWMNFTLGDTCALCGFHDAEYRTGVHVNKVHGLGLELNSHILRGSCNVSFEMTLDAFCDHLREFHGPVLLDQQILRDLVGTNFGATKVESVAETISSYNDSTTAKKVLALFPGAVVNSSERLDGEFDIGVATDDEIAENIVGSNLSKLKAEAEDDRMLSASLELVVAAPDTDAAVTTEQPEAMTLMQRSWNATLLEDWDSTHDRINKWMLHVLSSDCDGLAAVHRGYLLKAEQKHTTFLTTSDLSGRSWDRLVLKYWFLDEAALSIDALAASRAKAHPFDMPRGKGFLAVHSHNGHLTGMPPSINEAYADDAELMRRGETQSEGREALSRRRMERANSRAVNGPSST
ncbi:hypothetical protein LTR56_003065 [Elasticomyces elasticus]|nr:hypothetical protein LTR56_003065 [Elasticomyces elasticus]KAK3662127.1 hypothetical protein LTR22_007100 [Elasticomyces elasticus]KAK4927510.1 hypothetical protein LTR49_005650 [Elasticomyces elasticus]KAK5749764.1 hypothetical protein LTS12_020192 [Elasticomyces elasticus]